LLAGGSMVNCATCAEEASAVPAGACTKFCVNRRSEGDSPIFAASFDENRGSPTVERTLVASGQGYFPVALRLRDGRIAVVFRGGATHLGINGRLDIVFSGDEGKTWTRPTVVNDSPFDDRNPAFGQARDGSLVVCFWRTARYDEKGQYDDRLTDKPVSTWATRSDNGGRSWSSAAEIDVSDIGYGSPYGRMLTLPDGTMLMNVYGEGVRKGRGATEAAGQFSYLYQSTDQGKMWTRRACIGRERFNETGLLRLPSGVLWAAMRSADGQEMWLARSEDTGKTWSEPVKVTPPSVHPADLCLLPDGRVLLVAGYRAGPYGLRGLLADAAGDFAWERNFILVSDATNDDCGYPSSVVLRDGRVLTLYYAEGSREHPEWRVHCAAVAYRP
jgi:sialidase-1